MCLVVSIPLFLHVAGQQSAHAHTHATIAHELVQEYGTGAPIALCSDSRQVVYMTCAALARARGGRRQRRRREPFPRHVAPADGVREGEPREPPGPGVRVGLFEVERAAMRPVEPEPTPGIQPGTATPDAVPAPVPTAAQPGPGDPDSESKEAPEAQDATVVPVALEGNASAAWLIGDSGDRASLPASVSPGTYKIEADFGAGPVGAGNVTVREGAALTLNCDAFFNQCRTR